MERFALLFARSSLQGRHHESRTAQSRRSEPRLAGDTMKPDGSVRTPIWQRGEYVTPTSMCW